MRFTGAHAPTMDCEGCRELFQDPPETFGELLTAEHWDEYGYHTVETVPGKGIPPCSWIRKAREVWRRGSAAGERRYHYAGRRDW